MVEKMSGSQKILDDWRQWPLAEILARAGLEDVVDRRVMRLSGVRPPAPARRLC